MNRQLAACQRFLPPVLLVSTPGCVRADRSETSAAYTTAVPIEGVSTFATAADARSAILEYATRTAKGLTTNEDTLRALDNWVAEFNRVNKP